MHFTFSIFKQLGEFYYWIIVDIFEVQICRASKRSERSSLLKIYWQNIFSVFYFSLFHSLFLGNKFFQRVGILRMFRSYNTLWGKNFHWTHSLRVWYFVWGDYVKMCWDYSHCHEKLFIWTDFKMWLAKHKNPVYVVTSQSIVERPMSELLLISHFQKRWDLVFTLVLDL